MQGSTGLGGLGRFLADFHIFLCDFMWIDRVRRSSRQMQRFVFMVVSFFFMWPGMGWTLCSNGVHVIILWWKREPWILSANNSS